MKHIFVFFQFLCIAILAFVGNVVVFDLGLILQVAALAFGIWAVQSVGQNNWSVYPIPNKESSVAAKGAYKYVRHPMYTSLIFFFLPMQVRLNDWFSCLVYAILVITLILKIWFEEKQISAKHPEYVAFKKVTKQRLVPFIW
jgi:protein-S-isoprenylcysteine O-methyltransferase Ste14